MNLLPSLVGEAVFASKNSITSYKSATITRPQYNDVKTKSNDDILWNIDDPIGIYTGESQIVANQRWLNIEYTIYRKKRTIFLTGYKYSRTRPNNRYDPYTTTGWFQGAEVTTKSTTQVKDEQDALNDKNGNGIDDTLDNFLDQDLGIDNGGDQEQGNGFLGLGGSLMPTFVNTDEEGNSSLNITWIATAIVAILLGVGAWRKWGKNLINRKK